MANDKLEIINLPNNLKKKVGTGGSGAVYLKTLERAEQVIADMTDSYLDWVAEDLKKIGQADAKLEVATGDRKEEMEAVFEISHDIKGQGGTFVCGLMTAIATELCRLIEKAEKIGDEEVEVVKLHIAALKLVIDEDMKGQGGKAGEKMLAGLQQVCDKLLA